ncbi:DUF1697 domain-containing protein [Arthrobacter sp. 35W]|uniref:DUF1697 domain-containing protein n=1 Tax=Arthrobacter sp. 35W TaxID=1132441 RepID=UPI00040F6E31|nr:DUF1697 domain-containing protein [Arthrobacter sp. 35W]
MANSPTPAPGRYGVFLRGVNVGGINIKMAELREALTTLPLGSFSTLLASGNIVCTADASAPELKAMMESLLRERFGYDAWVVVFSLGQLESILDGFPYPADSPELHSYVTLSSETGALDELESLGRALDGTELARVAPLALAWQAPVGGTLDSPFSKLTAKAKYKSTTTTRNVRTLVKVREALA